MTVPFPFPNPTPEIEAAIAKLEPAWDRSITRLSHSTSTRQHFSYVPRARRSLEHGLPITGVPS